MPYRRKKLAESRREKFFRRRGGKPAQVVFDAVEKGKLKNGGEQKSLPPSVEELFPSTISF